MPKIAPHWPLTYFECGPEQGADNFIEWFRKADRGELEPFVLIIEGSIPNEMINGDGYFTGFGRHPDTNQPITLNEWLDRLAPLATIVVAVGTCAAYGGIHAMAGNPTGAMGVPDYLARLGLDIQGWHPHRLCAWMPGAPGQSLRDDPVPALPGRRSGTNDPLRRTPAPA